MGRLDPETFEWIEDDAELPVPAPVSVPGAAPDQSMYDVTPGQGAGAAPTDIDADGGILPVPAAVTQKTSGSGGKVATKGLVETKGRQDAAGRAQVEAAKKQAEADAKKAEAEAAKADREAMESRVAGIQAEQVIKEQGAIKLEGQRRMQEARARYDQEAKSDSLFEGMSPMRKFLWIAASVLGGYSAARTGRNQPLELLQKSVEDFNEKHTNRLKVASSQLKDASDWEGQALKDHTDNELKLAPLKKAAAYRQFADVMRRELEANKKHLDAAGLARGQKAIADAEAAAVKTEMDYEQFLAPTFRSGSIDQRPGGKPTEASGVGASRAGLIVQTLTDAMNSPGITTEGLRTINMNDARKRGAEKHPILDVVTGGRVSPAEGQQQGLSQSDRQALSRQSVLNETITYLTTGAAASKEEGTSKTAQLQIQPSDDATTRRTKLLNAYRYAKAAAQIGRASMTPEHLEQLEALGKALGVDGVGGAKPSQGASLDAVRIKAAISRAEKAGDKAAVDDLKERLRALGQ